MSNEKGQPSNAAAAQRKRAASFAPQDIASICDGETQDLALELIDESDLLRLRLPPYPSIEELADKIRRFGQTTPLFVRPKGDGYELISGYRRRAALELIGATTAYCRVYRELSDSDAYDLAISENQDRGSLTDLERAEICVRLQREGKTSPQIATRTGWTGERQVYNHLRLARDGSKEIRATLQAGRIGFHDRDCTHRSQELEGRRNRRARRHTNDRREPYVGPRDHRPPRPSPKGARLAENRRAPKEGPHNVPTSKSTRTVVLPSMSAWIPAPPRHWTQS